MDQIFSDLEVLVPPRESQDFGIFLFSSLIDKKYGEVVGSICDDYDYKIVAKSDKKQNVDITIYRNEYDLETVDPEFFKQLAKKGKQYCKQCFEKGYWKKEKTFSQLFPGYKEVDEENVFGGIGIFDFTMYFMKKTYTSQDEEKFFYRKFLSNARKDWLDRFGGIKLFRDNFRVRPYGEINNTSFDWLGLGARKSQSPASVAKAEGGYKVPPANVSGNIKISRLTNVNFEDKSSREGLQENKTFLIFKKLICAIINEFETDRALIAREMNKYYQKKHKTRIDREKAEELVETILRDKSKKDDSKEESKKNRAKEKITLLAELNKDKSDEIEKLKDEQKILRGLASSGIVIASFTHELSNLNDVLGERVEELKQMLSKKAPPCQFDDVPDYLNPYIMMEDIKKQDLKIQNWLKFSIGAARKDKRKRKKLFLYSYFKGLNDTWQGVLENRHIILELDTANYKEAEMRVFEIDLDSIFNNLIVNSIDAFLRNREKGQRIIKISLNLTSKEIIINYLDNGPGLSPDIDKPEKIFDPLFTTKLNKHTGEEEGTGLGMWLVHSIVKDNDGKLKLMFLNKGFGMKVSFPRKYLREKSNV